MELRDYFKIIGRSLPMIIGTAIAITLLVLLWSMSQPTKHEASATVVVNKANTVPQRGASYYQYDKFYSIQASSLYADTLASLLSSPDTAKEIYVQAGLPVPEVSLKKLSRIFKPRRQPPVTLNITVTDREREKAEKLVNASVAVLQAKVDQQRTNDDPDHYFSLLKGSTVVAEAKQDHLLNAILGLIGGLIIGLILAFFREYLKPTTR